MITTSYRPRNPGHDYYGAGTYLITLVVSGRAPLLGRLGDDVKHPEVSLSHLGRAVEQAWNSLPERQAAHGNRVAVHACVSMPEHFHGVIEVLEPMRWSLGDIVQAFKATCTGYWQRQQGLVSSSNRPISVDCHGDGVPAWLREKAGEHGSEGSLIRAMSKRQRREYYALTRRDRQPLFDENYDDTVCLDGRHREAMIAYVRDNPRRAIMRRAMPRLLQRSLHVMIGDREYGTFGNLFLLRWAHKVAVRCHRRHPVTGEPYERSDDFARRQRQWVDAVMGGATVLVTPGISRGEQLMMRECLAKGYPLIHLQKEPITDYWKPELRRFEACAGGSLLIVAPWGLDSLPAVDGVPAATDYSRFHNLNRLAAEISAFGGKAKILNTCSQ